MVPDQQFRLASLRCVVDLSVWAWGFPQLIRGSNLVHASARDAFIRTKLRDWRYPPRKTCSWIAILDRNAINAGQWVTTISWPVPEQVGPSLIDVVNHGLHLCFLFRDLSHTVLA